MLTKLLEKLKARSDGKTKTAAERFDVLVTRCADGKTGMTAKDVEATEAVLVAAGRSAGDLEREVERLLESRSLAAVASDADAHREKLTKARVRLSELDADFSTAAEKYHADRGTVSAEVSALQNAASVAGKARQRLANEYGDLAPAAEVLAEDRLKAACERVASTASTLGRLHVKSERLELLGDSAGLEVCRGEIDAAERAVADAKSALATAEVDFEKG